MEHSAVGESSSEQQIRESADYTCIVRKTGALAIVEPGLTAGRQAGRPLGRRKCGKVRKFKFRIFDI